MKLPLAILTLALLACGRGDPPPPKPVIHATIGPGGAIGFRHWTEIQLARSYQDKEGRETAARYASDVGAKNIPAGTVVVLQACSIGATAAIRLDGEERFIGARYLVGDPCTHNPPK